MSGGVLQRPALYRHFSGLFTLHDLSTSPLIGGEEQNSDRYIISFNGDDMTDFVGV